MRPIALLGLLAACATGSVAPARPQALDLGGVRVTVSMSPAAQVFHIVDQLAEWSPYCHRQYGRWFAAHQPLSAADRGFLSDHALLRKRRGWGQGLEQAFYVDGSIAEAAAAAQANGLLNADETRRERAILEHFAPILQDLLDGQRERLEEFRARLREDLGRLREEASRLARLTKPPPALTVPAFLVSNPAAKDLGGGFDGGRLVVEVPEDLGLAEEVFLHELFHAYLAPRRADFAAAANACALDQETLQESVAYAFSPGLVHPAGRDPLADEVAREQGRPLTESYVRFHRLGLAARPKLDAALREGAEFSALLAGLCPLWREIARE